MPTNILMPALSPTMEKGNLAKWLKKEGDKVKSGDVIAEIETDKATMEFEAVDEGTIAKIVVPEGTQDVAVNAIIAVMAGGRRGREGGERCRAGRESAARRPSKPKRQPKAADAPKAEATRSLLPPRRKLPRQRQAAAADRRRPHLRVAAGHASRQGSRRRSVARVRAPVRMAASLRATSTTRNPARAR